ncbi:MAG: radical SAM protein [Chloroflexota bacterium]|nr:radical SAM protein [Chloroflexota bacterium]
MTQVERVRASGILSKATGFISSFDFTLNPYSGCAFACNYCYAAFFAKTQALQDAWGQWVNVKENALELLRKRRKRPLLDQAIYMSSVTDPYQPVEKQLELTRDILRELLDYHQVRLVIQTRSPLVTRDLDLLHAFPYARVNMTVTTDDEAVRKAFEPLCPANPRRLEAIAQVAAAGVDACVTLTPLLPVRDASAFAKTLAATGVQKFVIQNFHATKSRFVAGTGAAARALLHERGWDDAHYAQVRQTLAEALPTLREGRHGFAPVWA